MFHFYYFSIFLLLYFVNNILFIVSPDHQFGLHGYDNDIPSMRAFFMATGPAFVSNKDFLPFDSVDLYDLFANVLNIPSTANNGTYTNIQGLLIQPEMRINNMIRARG